MEGERRHYRWVAGLPGKAARAFCRESGGVLRLDGAGALAVLRARRGLLVGASNGSRPGPSYITPALLQTATLEAGVRSAGLSGGRLGWARLSIIFQTPKSRIAAKPSAPIASTIFFTMAHSKKKL